MVTYAGGTCTKMFILNSTIMATIKTVLRPYKNNEGKPVQLYLLVICLVKGKGYTEVYIKEQKQPER